MANSHVVYISSALPALVSLGNHVIDIAVMIKLSNQSSRIVVLNGRNGSVRWLFTLTNPLPVPPVGVPKTDGIPEGLLLWLPKSKVHSYLNERHRKYHGNDETTRKTKEQEKKQDGPRRRRELNDDDDGMVDDVIQDLLAMMEEGDDEKSRDEGEEHVADDVNANDDKGGDDGDDSKANGGIVNTHEKNMDGGDSDNDGDDIKLAVDDDDDDNTSESDGDGDVIADDIDKESNHHKDDKDKDKEDSGGVTDVNNRPYSDSTKLDGPTDDRRYSDGAMPDNPARDRPDSDDTNPDNPARDRPDFDNTNPDNPARDRPDFDNTNPDNPNDHIIHPNPTLHSDQTAMSGQKRSVDYEALKKFLRNWKNNLQPEHQPQASKPSTGLSTPSTRMGFHNESPNTEEKKQKKLKLRSSSSSEISPLKMTRTIAVNKSKRGSLMEKQHDKSLLLACDKQAKDLSKELSVVLVYRDEKRRRLRMMEIAEDDIINLGNLSNEPSHSLGNEILCLSCAVHLRILSGTTVKQRNDTLENDTWFVVLQCSPISLT